jgi:hypothetical protein
MYLRELDKNYNLTGFSKSQILQLVEDPEFILTFNLVAMAKNMNFFSTMDEYMKEFSRILLELPQAEHIQQRLEKVLSKEIAI